MSSGFIATYADENVVADRSVYVVRDGGQPRARDLADHDWT